VIERNDIFYRDVRAKGPKKERKKKPAKKPKKKPQSDSDGELGGLLDPLLGGLFGRDVLWDYDWPDDVDWDWQKRDGGFDDESASDTDSGGEDGWLDVKINVGDGGSDDDEQDDKSEDKEDEGRGKPVGFLGMFFRYCLCSLIRTAYSLIIGPPG
jgi:hypothetical protein